MEGMTEFWTEHGIFGVAPLPHGSSLHLSGAAASDASRRDVKASASDGSRTLPARRRGSRGRHRDLVVTDVVAWISGQDDGRINPQSKTPLSAMARPR
jgi:hypothetical protein